MKLAIALLVAVMFTAVAAAPAVAADDTKVKSATRQGETGAKKIGAGTVGGGVSDAAKAIGKTAADGRRLGLFAVFALAASGRF